MGEFDDFDGTPKELRDRFEGTLAEKNQALETAKQEAEQAKAEKEAAARELAFAKAGIDISDEKLKYFVKGYEGELEPDAIKKAATDAGFLKAEGQPPEETPEDDTLKKEGEALAEMEGVTAGTALSGSKDAELHKGMKEIYEKGGDTAEVARFLGQHGYPVAQGHG